MLDARETHQRPGGRHPAVAVGLGGDRLLRPPLRLLPPWSLSPRLLQPGEYAGSDVLELGAVEVVEGAAALGVGKDMKLRAGVLDDGGDAWPFRQAGGVVGQDTVPREP